jgi:ferritin-like metal-binding protein YciE
MVQRKTTMAKTAKKLDDLFHDTLKDIYFAEKKILSALPKMAKAAQDGKLKAAFEKHHGETETHVSRLEQVFDAIDAKPQGKTCDAIMGIIEEGQEIMADYKGSPALDAGLLAAAQAVEHYEISRYGTLRTWAEELGLSDAAELLEVSLEEEKATDEALTQIAETVVNQEAQSRGGLSRVKIVSRYRTVTKGRRNAAPRARPVTPGALHSLPVGALEHGFDGLRAGVADEPLQRAENLALHSLGAENEADNRNCDQNQRSEREHGVIGKRRAQARVLVLRPLADRLSERGEPCGHCLPLARRKMRSGGDALSTRNRDFTNPDRTRARSGSEISWREECEHSAERLSHQFQMRRPVPKVRQFALPEPRMAARWSSIRRTRC